MEMDRAKSHIHPNFPARDHANDPPAPQGIGLQPGTLQSCPYCNGRGTVKSARTMSVEIHRRLTSVIRRL